jgi:ABC-type sugar transport system ATPase subunit
MSGRSTTPASFEVRGITKRYGGVVALQDVSIEFAPGEIHALVGENGAGKSTLGKIITGAIAPDAGTVVIDGETVGTLGPRSALAHGIAGLSQELSLVDCLSVTQNIFLGMESTHGGVLDRRRLRSEAVRLMEETGIHLPPDAPVEYLGASDRAMVELLRALTRGRRLIVLDEPTARLTQQEADRLYAVMRHLADRGITLVYVSHFLDEVLQLSDRVSVLKDGRFVRTAVASEETPDTLIRSMLGRSLDVVFPDKGRVAPDAPLVLRVENLTRPGVIDGVSFEVRAGEVLGIAGLVGSGRTEVLRALFGADPHVSGVIELDGRSVQAGSPRAAIRAGLAMLPESRKDDGLVMNRSVSENLTYAHIGRFSRLGVVTRRRELAASADMMQKLGVKAESPSTEVWTLSGGNQQKLLFGKWLVAPPKVFLADEPARGVDVGAKQAIYALIAGLAREGMAMVVVSSELDEVTGLANRILVMRQGRVVGEVPGDAEHDEILNLAFGQATSQSSEKERV